MAKRKQDQFESIEIDDEPLKSAPAVFCIYIMRSKKDGRLYIGSGVNAEESVKRHNFGDNRATNGQRPWVLLYQEGFVTKPEAVQREWFLKSNEGKAFVTSLHIT